MLEAGPRPLSSSQPKDAEMPRQSLLYPQREAQSSARCWPAADPGTAPLPGAPCCECAGSLGSTHSSVPLSLPLPSHSQVSVYPCLEYIDQKRQHPRLPPRGRGAGTGVMAAFAQVPCVAVNAEHGFRKTRLDIPEAASLKEEKTGNELWTPGVSGCQVQVRVCGPLGQLSPELSLSNARLELPQSGRLHLAIYIEHV